MTDLFGVNRPFRAMRQFREPPDLAAKIAAGCRGASPKVRSDSIEARENSHFDRKIKRFVGRLDRSIDVCPAPSGRRLTSDRFPGSQPNLSVPVQGVG